MDSQDNIRNECGAASNGRRTRSGHPEAGFGIVEVLVGTVMIVGLSAGTFRVIQSMTRAGAEEQTRATAHAVAQSDQSRLRSLELAALSNYSVTRAVEESGETFTVSSKGEFVSDSTGTASCDSGSASADYVRVTSRVSWPTIGPRPPVVLQSTITPPNGSIDGGALAVRVENASAVGMEGVGLSGSGSGSFSGATNELGCVIFGNLKAGNYQLRANTSGLVDRDGEQGGPRTTSVIPYATNSIALQYDRPGSIEVGFTTKIDGALRPARADSIVVFNTGMSAPKAYGEVGDLLPRIIATPLFPFASPDAVYAGSCTGNDPNPSGADPPPASIASLLVPAGGRALGTIQLPAFDLRVWTGADAANPGQPADEVDVVIRDRVCTDDKGKPITRTYETNADGRLDEPGLPSGSYDVCVDNYPAKLHRDYTNVQIKSLDRPLRLDAYIGSFGLRGRC